MTAQSVLTWSAKATEIIGEHSAEFEGRSRLPRYAQRKTVQLLDDLFLAHIGVGRPGWMRQ
jgi:hypothetical protein